MTPPLICKTPLMMLSGLPFYHKLPEKVSAQPVFLWLAVDGAYGAYTAGQRMPPRIVEVLSGTLYQFSIPPNVTAQAALDLLTDKHILGLFTRVLQGFLPDERNNRLSDDARIALNDIRENIEQRFVIEDLPAAVSADEWLREYLCESLKDGAPARVERITFDWPGISVNVCHNDAPNILQSLAGTTGVFLLDLDEHIVYCKKQIGSVRI